MRISWGGLVIPSMKNIQIAGNGLVGILILRSLMGLRQQEPAAGLGLLLWISLGRE